MALRRTLFLSTALPKCFAGMTIMRSKPRLLLIVINRIPLQDKAVPCLKMRLISSFFLMISILVRLLLIACREAVSALGSAACKNLTATLCSHSCAETELSCSLHLAWMIGSLDDRFSFLCSSYRLLQFQRCKAVIFQAKGIYPAFGFYQSVV